MQILLSHHANPAAEDHARQTPAELTEAVEVLALLHAATAGNKHAAAAGNGGGGGGSGGVHGRRGVGVGGGGGGDGLHTVGWGNAPAHAPALDVDENDWGELGHLESGRTTIDDEFEFVEFDAHNTEG
jgi:hypothetical protein